jgi:thiamine biosynthesis protein ThiS
MTTAYLNGQPHTFSPDIATPRDLIRAFGLHEQRVAVEINGLLLDRSLLATTPLRTGDRIEIVSFVGGG